MLSDRAIRTVMFVGLVGLCVAGRVLPHEANFTPVAAAALFAGFAFSRRTVAAAAPLAGMAISDWIVGGYDWRVTIVVYAALLLPVALGGLLKARLSVFRVAGASLTGAVVFFVVTNLAHWAFMGMYAPTLGGLMESYVAAVPFFRNTLAGDVLWAAGLFGAYAAVREARGLVIARRATVAA